MDVLFKSDRQILTELGDKFKLARINKRLTQDDVAEKTGIARRTISRFESGENISVLNLIALLRQVGKLESFAKLLANEIPDPRIGNDTQRKRYRS